MNKVIWFFFLLAAHLKSTAGETCICESQQIVPECCCDFKAVTTLNRNHIGPILKDLINTKFFSYYRVALCGECSHEGFSPPACGSPECAVCECPPDDVPCDETGRCYLEPSHANDAVSPCTGNLPEATLSDSLGFDAAVDFSLSSSSSSVRWDEQHKDSWTVRANGGEESYVDLKANPERWTGYTQAQNASDIWRAIYAENCFTKAGSAALGLNQPIQCREQRVFTKIISGLHASISSHIASQFCLKREGPHEACLEFGEDLGEFNRRLYEHPERIQNLYFVYLFMLRAAIKVTPVLEQYDFDAGDAVEASLIRSKLKQLTKADTGEGVGEDVPCLSVTRTPFDEATLFTNGRSALLSSFRDTFRNITSIMDCVGCDKCKLWGKLQTEGLGAGLKIIFATPEEIANLDIGRAEMVAFVNTLARFSSSVEEVARMSEMLRKHQQQPEQQPEQPKEQQQQRNPEQKQQEYAEEDHGSSAGNPSSSWDVTAIVLLTLFACAMIREISGFLRHKKKKTS